VFEHFRGIVMTARLVECTGRVQREGAVIHVIAAEFRDRTPLLAQLARGADIPVASRDFH